MVKILNHIIQLDDIADKYIFILSTSYGTCNMKKKECDVKFKKCLLHNCKNFTADRYFKDKPLEIGIYIFY